MVGFVGRRRAGEIVAPNRIGKERDDLNDSEMISIDWMHGVDTLKYKKSPDVKRGTTEVIQNNNNTLEQGIIHVFTLNENKISG